MTTRLQILHLEDNVQDSELVQAMLERDGFETTVVRVETRSDFLRAVEKGGLDLIICDYSLPSFDGLSALRLAREIQPEVPFILMSGTIGEEAVIESVKSGATDYVLKHRPERLVPSVRRALREVEDRAKRRQVEETLRRREKWFRALTENALDLVTILDARGWFKYQSPSAERVLGYQPDELFGQDAFTFVHPADRPTMVAAFQRCVKQPDLTLALAFRFRRQDGSWCFLEAAARSLLHDPEIAGVVINSRDMTERKRTEEELRQSEERFRQITENVADLIAVIDLQGRRLYNSPSYRSVLGDPGQLRGTISFDEIHPDDRERIMRLFRETVATGVGQRAEYRFIPKDGKIRYIESQGSVIREADGRVANVIVVSRDITERKNAEEQIREQAALLDKAQDAICVTDMDQRIVYWNKSAENLYGWSSAEASGQYAHELLFKAESSRALEALKSLIARREWKGELHQVTKTGSDIMVESRWTLVHDAHGNPKSILVINTDITEKKKLETQFFRSQRLENIGMLASGIAHDLNNVLAPIMMAVPMLRGVAAVPAAQKLLDTLEVSVRRGAELVGQILSFARGVEGEPKLVQLKHVLDDIENIIRETFPKSIQLQKNINPKLQYIRGNATQIHQVLLNLCVNARDAMAQGGVLTVEAGNGRIDEARARQFSDAQAGPCVVVTVTDNGTGIPKEMLERIFDPFFTTKETGKGTGLGLATVRGIVKNHRGILEVRSEMGRGSSFIVSLPAVQMQSSIEPEQKKVELPSGKGELILVVDDEAAIRQIAKATLENYSYRVLTADNGVEAVAIYTKHHREIKAVVLDSMMPFMDGGATAQALREICPTVRIVGVSGLADSERPLAGLSGWQVFLTKPYGAGQLVEALHQVLKAPGPRGGGV